MNEVAVELDQLINELGQLGWFKTARDADGEDDEKLQREVDSLLKVYPFLKRDNEYVAFLRRYAGALLVRDDDGFLVSFFGLSHDIGFHIVEGGGEPIADDCLITFDLIVPIGKAKETRGMAFGFAATPDLRWGIYRFVKDSKPSWYCQTFFEWLRIVIKTRGRLFD
jgi:hypothetical protein